MNKKKIILFVVLSLLLIPFSIKAEEQQVKIDSIKLIEKSETADIINEPMYSNLNINFDAKFKEINDYVKYEVTVANEEVAVYLLSYNKEFESSEYIKYEVELTDENKILKENSKINFLVTITYLQEIPDELLEENMYLETNTLELLLEGKEQLRITNPQTSNNLEIILGILIVIFIGIAYTTMNDKKINKTLSIILIIASVLLPITAFAIEIQNITVNTAVLIEKE